MLHLPRRARPRKSIGPDLSTVARRMTLPQYNAVAGQSRRTHPRRLRCRQVDLNDRNDARRLCSRPGQPRPRAADQRREAAPARRQRIQGDYAGSAPLHARVSRHGGAAARSAGLSRHAEWRGCGTAQAGAAAPAAGDRRGRASGKGDWPTYNGNLDGNRNSPLEQINTQHVSKLQLQWTYPINFTGLETTPVVVDGVMYVTGNNQVFALSGKTGREIWRYERPKSSGRRRSPETRRSASIAESRCWAIASFI